jgi:hemoglobin-like flavoprotein
MTPPQPYLIRKSFALVEERRGIAALMFYRRLFALDPGLRPLFKNDIEEQGRKLTEMLAALIGMLERPGALAGELAEMGARHATYGVEDRHYAVVGAALMGMLAEVCGPAFTPDVREAWTALYDAVQSAMREGASAAGTCA